MGTYPMSRHLLLIYSQADRERAMKYIRVAPVGTRVELKAAKRSLDQNSALWAMLSDVAAQKDHFGRKYTPDIWKLLFMDALGREMKFVPALDGSTVVPIGQSSSDLSREEMTALLDFIDSWAAQNGVTLHGPHEAVA
jgi:hypothetical protein